MSNAIVKSDYTKAISIVKHFENPYEVIYYLYFLPLQFKGGFANFEEEQIK